MAFPSARVRLHRSDEWRMSQIFHRSANTLFRLALVGVVLLGGFLTWLLYALQSSDYVTGAFVAVEQPIQFSHERHVSGNGIDCRYCHTSVEDSSFAGIPPTKTCMNCRGCNRPWGSWVRRAEPPGIGRSRHPAARRRKEPAQDCYGPARNRDS